MHVLNRTLTLLLFNLDHFIFIFQKKISQILVYVWYLLFNVNIVVHVTMKLYICVSSEINIV